MIIDDVIIRAHAGDGGRGAVAFDKNKMAIGPTGGSGGAGGSIYFEGVSDIGALRQFRFTKEIKAINGENGKPQFRDGAAGKDAVLKVPVGTVIHNLTRGEDYEITKVGERLLVAVGGRGGRGNFHFRSPKNTSPLQFQKGLPGDEYELHLELKMIADVGFIGYPNAGKSSLLNELTKAGAKVANYQFTTLEPNLGAYYELILADIPGLIEGASVGKGLGIKFLRHVERTRVLFHLVSAESEDPVHDYKTIRKELAAFQEELSYKPEHVFLSKTDVLEEKEIKVKLQALKKAGIKAGRLSILDDDSLKTIKDILNKIGSEKIALSDSDKQLK
jgi:GTP-binding protein